MKTQEESLKESLERLVDRVFDDAAELSNQAVWLGSQLGENSDYNEATKQWLKEYIATKECDNVLGDEIKDFLMNY